MTEQPRPSLSPDAWQDRDGRIYTGDGPYQNRPTRRIRRWLHDRIRSARRSAR